MNSIQKFIDAAANSDSTAIQDTFGSLMNDKIKVMLDIKKIELASEIYQPSLTESRDFKTFSKENLILWLQTNWTGKTVSPQFRQELDAAVREAQSRGLYKHIKLEK